MLRVLKLTPGQGTPMEAHKRPPEERECLFSDLRAGHRCDVNMVCPDGWVREATARGYIRGIKVLSRLLSEQAFDTKSA